MNSRRTFIKTGALMSAAAYVASPMAQTSPRTVRIVVGFLPGGLTDAIARKLGDGLNRLNLGATFVVDNRPGASGRISVMNIKDSPADGLHLLLTPANTLTLLNHFFKHEGFNPITDLKPVSGVFSFAYCFSVGPSVPASVKTIKDYLAWVKANPSKSTYAGLTAAPQHMLTAQLSRISDTPLTLVPYKGGGPLMVQDILRGDVPAVAHVTGDALQWQGPDKLRTLATFTRTRSTFFPNVPTIGEAGFPELVVDDYGAVHAPKGTPNAIVARWGEAIRQVISQPDFKSMLATQAAEPYPIDSQQVANSMKEEYAFWGKLVETTGITMR